MLLQTEYDLLRAVDRAAETTPVLDLHTHLYPKEFGPLALCGLDELLTYHYLIAETMLYRDGPEEDFFRLSTREQAEKVWQTLFVEHSPISEATRGVLTTLRAFGCDPACRDLSELRRQYGELSVEERIDRSMQAAGVRAVVMTNDPIDPAEAALWQSGVRRDPRFLAALRLDRILLGGREDLDKDWLIAWAKRMDAAYMAVSLPDSVYSPGSSPDRIARMAVVPACRELNIPYAMMIGVRRQVNPAIRLAGDGVGRADLSALESLLRDYPDVKFMATCLSMENQHELTVLARKFRNLLLFGCWWFLNDPGFIEQITRMRLELLGPAFVPQHSDARIFDQLVYKWPHSRAAIGKVLKEKYLLTHRAGYRFAEEEIRRDVFQLFGGYFEDFCKRKFA